MSRSMLCVAALASALLASPVAAQVVTHTAGQLVAAGVAPTPPFGTLVEPVGTQAIDFGVDYTFGNVEGIFIDPPAALCGINASGICDLLTSVDGRIVQLGTTLQGLTSFINLTAGSSAPGALTLSVFGLNNNLLATATGIGSSGPFTISRPTADIAYFSIGGADTFGVGSVSIETPIAAAISSVPEPATWAIMLLGFGVAGAAMRRRRTSLRFATA